MLETLGKSIKIGLSLCCDTDVLKQVQDFHWPWHFCCGDITFYESGPEYSIIPSSPVSTGAMALQIEQNQTYTVMSLLSHPDEVMHEHFRQILHST